MSKMISDIVQKYYNEANQGLQKDKPPSALKRGEGTEKDFFILKIDLVGSTKFVRNRFPQTYLKLAHVFLSTVDEITSVMSSLQSRIKGDMFSS
jgi:class 3 adenylate cyclase